MAGVTIKKAVVLNNPAPYSDPYNFEITYQAIQDLDDDLNWKVIYLSSPGDETLDQELEDVVVGPIQSGVYKFILEAPAPDPTKIPSDDLIGNTAVVLSCCYKEQEFIRVGFYVYVDYKDDDLKEDPPENPIYEKYLVLDRYPTFSLQGWSEQWQTTSLELLLSPSYQLQTMLRLLETKRAAS